MPATQQKILPIGNLENFHRERHIFDLFFTRGIGRLSVITPNIIRVQYTTEKDWPYKPLLSIEEKEWKSVPIQIRRHAEKLDITTPRLIISLVFRSFNIRIYDHEGHLLTQDHPKCSVSFRGNQINVHKKAPLGVNYLGMGDSSGGVDRSGKTYKFEMQKNSERLLKSHQNSQLIFPFFAYKGKENAIGYFLDNPNYAAVDLKNSAKGDITMTTESGNLDYYCIIGSNLQEVSQGISLLTGNSVFPPRWSLEIMKGMETPLDNKAFLKSYNKVREEFLLTSSVIAHQPSEDRTGLWDQRPLNLLKSFRRSDQIPHFLMEMDQKIGQDKLSEKKYAILKEKGAFIESNATSGEPQKVNDGVYLDPFYEAGSNYLQERLSPLFNEQLRGVEVFDHTPPWNRKDIKKGLVRCVQEIVGEDGESIEKLVHEVDAKHLIGYMPNGLARGIQQAYLNSKQELRPLIVTSCGYVGIQRYAVIRPIHSKLDWSDLPKYLTRLLNLNISGAPLLCVDIELTKDFDEDFLCRLIQTLAFVPLIRLRLAKDYDLNAILNANKFLNTLEFIFNLRESWLPYLYQLMWRSHTEGTPILYPSIYFFNEWEPGKSVQSQFLVGEHVLVAPVMNKKTQQKIDLPPGEWVDAKTFESYIGDQSIDYEVNDDSLPMFLREGAIVPRFETTLESMSKSIFITFFPKSNVVSESYIYDDDGETNKYQSEARSFVQIRLSSTKKGYVLKFSRRQGRINPSWTNYVLCFVRSRLDIQRVVYNRSELEYMTSLEELTDVKSGFFLDDEKELLYVKIPYEREGGVVRF